MECPGLQSHGRDFLYKLSRPPVSMPTGVGVHPNPPRFTQSFTPSFPTQPRKIGAQKLTIISFHPFFLLDFILGVGKGYDKGFKIL